MKVMNIGNRGKATSFDLDLGNGIKLMGLSKVPKADGSFFISLANIKLGNKYIKTGTLSNDIQKEILEQL